MSGQSNRDMTSTDSLIDNTGENLADIYSKLARDSREIRICTGYFYVSGFNLVKEDLENLADPANLGRAPLRILMGATSTDARTAEEIEEGMSLRERIRKSVAKEIEDLNKPQIERLDNLKDFIAENKVQIRVHDPEQGIFHSKGACFRSEVDGSGTATTVVGSSNFSKKGHTQNVELNVMTEERAIAEEFEEWFDNYWANSQEFSEDLVDIIDNNERYQNWKEEQKETTEEFGTHIEPFEMYKMLAYDELGGKVGEGRESPLYYFQHIGYESAREKLDKYNGCIVSDSVGLGKSFIGGELLLDYRNQGKNCLLIVPANLTKQWANLLEEDTNEDGDPYFNLQVDGKHLRVMSISKFQNLTREDVKNLDEQFDVILIDEAHRFRNMGEWKADATSDEDYKGTRRHANLRMLKGKTMIMLTATPINNTVEDLQNLITLFTGANEIRNNANLDFSAFDEYIDISEDRKELVSGDEEVSQKRLDELNKRLQTRSEEISKILNEVMVLRTRNHVKDQIQEEDDIDISFKPPEVHPEEYDLPMAYRPVYDSLPNVMDALHLPHITIKNPQAGMTLKALYKLNLLKRLESSTFAFVQSIETLHDSETRLLSLLENFKEDVHISDIHTISNDNEEEETVTLDEYTQNEEEAQELENTLEDLGFDQGSLREGSQEEVQELADATVGEVINYIYEDLTLLAYFVSMFIGDIGEQAYEVRDNSVELRSWLDSKGVANIPDVPEDELNPTLYPNADLSDAPEATRDFYESVFALREFRDPKIDRLVKILNESEGKVLVFTQYRATARYVHSSLLGHSDSPITSSNSAVVVGGDDHKQEVIKRFAPNASGYQRQLTKSGETELQYVVATDTLSEGVNLQDVETVVNYDLPWNPMRIVQRVGRVDRIGNTDDKYVHNFYPDGDIEATIKLLKRLQAKISDIALIVGKENNILDPNEDEVLERAGVETEKTIGEIQRDEIEDTLKKSRAVRDINELDDTRRNAVFSQAGSDEERAFERLLLREELLDDHDLEPEDFEYAEEYFETTPDERDLLYTCYNYFEGTLGAGVFGLAHIWYDDKDSPLNRIERILCHVPFGKEPQHIGKVRAFNIDADTEDKMVEIEEETVLEERAEIEEITEERREELEAGQSEEQFKQGGNISKEQERIISYLEHLHNKEGIEKADELRDRLAEVGLDHTDEDRILRETFREDERTLMDWDTEDFFEEVEEFLNEYVEKSYQETLAGSSGVNAELMCWGVIEK